MDIIIKSFNRPYYLERCIRSIQTFMSGDFKIRILDDGTPPVYLNKIAALFPEVKIYRSPGYEIKVKAIEDHINNIKPYSQFTIPAGFWVEQVTDSSDIFFLFEDDFWLTAPVKLDEILPAMVKHNLMMLKVAWLGNNTFVKGDKIKLNTGVEEVVPDLNFFVKNILVNKFKIRSVLYRLGYLNPRQEFKWQLPFYTLYSVGSAFYYKKYWLHLWEGADQNVNESLQIIKAVDWFLHKKGRYAKTTTEVARTSFITSATNMYPDIALDIFRFNYHLNQAWLNQELDAMENFPGDFRLDYLMPILAKAEDAKTAPAEWLKWINRFKGIYSGMGCIVEP